MIVYKSTFEFSEMPKSFNVFGESDKLENAVWYDIDPADFIEVSVSGKTTTLLVQRVEEIPYPCGLECCGICEVYLHVVPA